MATLPRKMVIAMMAIAATGLGLATYLSWASLTSSQVAGCGGGQIFDCNHVLHSKWSTVFGVPVGIPAASLYLVTLASLATALFSTRKGLRKVALGVVSVAAMSAGLAAIWFISLQVFVLDHLCQYCLAAHACGLLLAGIVLWKMPLGKTRTIVAGLAAMAGVGVLASGQLMAEEPKTYEIQEFSTVAGQQPETDSNESSGGVFSAPGFEAPAEPETAGNIFEAPADSSENVSQADRQQRRFSDTMVLSLVSLWTQTAMITAPRQDQAGKQAAGSTSKQQPQQQERRLINVSGGKFQLDVRQWPLVGSADAKQVFVEMYDYTCPHCRANHQSVKEAMSQLDGEVAWLALSVPMNSSCNNTVARTDAIHAEACELARLSVAVWRAEPARFGEFHEYLFEGNTAPTAAAARQKAEQLVGKEKLDAEMSGRVAGQYVAKQVELYRSLGAGTVPKLLFPTTTVNGKVGSTSELVQIIRQQMAGMR